MNVRAVAEERQAERCLALSRTCPIQYHQRLLATIFKLGFQMQDHKREATWKNEYVCEVYRGDACRAIVRGLNPRLGLEKMGEMKKKTFT